MTRCPNVVLVRYVGDPYLASPVCYEFRRFSVLAVTRLSGEAGKQFVGEPLSRIIASPLMFAPLFCIRMKPPQRLYADTPCRLRALELRRQGVKAGKR